MAATAEDNPLAKQWWVRVGGKVHGPLDNAKLSSLAKSGKIAPDTELATSAEGPWHQAGRVKGLVFASSTAPAPKVASEKRLTPESATPASPSPTTNPAAEPPAAPKAKAGSRLQRIVRVAAGAIGLAILVSGAIRGAGGLGVIFPSAEKQDYLRFCEFYEKEFKPSYPRLQSLANKDDATAITIIRTEIIPAFEVSRQRLNGHKPRTDKMRQLQTLLGKSLGNYREGIALRADGAEKGSADLAEEGVKRIAAADALAAEWINEMKELHKRFPEGLKFD